MDVLRNSEGTRTRAGIRVLPYLRPYLSCRPY